MRPSPTPTDHRSFDHRRGRRFAAGLLLAATLVSTPSLAPPVAASTAGKATVERSMSRNQVQVLDLVNRARRSRGQRSLATNGLMNQRAQKWAEHLRSMQRLDHRAPPFGTPAGWCAAAENVGMSGNGGTILGTHKAFMRSSGHKHNILNGRWTAVGVGVARDRRGEYFIVHAFADFSC